MIMLRRWFALCAGCAEYEALPRDYQPQEKAQAQAQAAAIAANDDFQSE